MNWSSVNWHRAHSPQPLVIHERRLEDVLRLWMFHRKAKSIAVELGMKPKKVRRYIRAAQAVGLPRRLTEELTDERLAAVSAELARQRAARAQANMTTTSPTE